MQTTIQRKIKQYERKYGRVGARKPSARQQALNLRLMQTVCACPGGKDGRVVQIWAKLGETGQPDRMLPVAFFDDDSLADKWEKSCEKSYITKTKSRELYFSVAKFLPWQKGQTTGIRDASRCAYMDVIYVDIDAHSETPDTTMLQGAAERLRYAVAEGLLPEVCITATGRGFGIYALLAQPYSPRSEAARAKYRALGEGLARAVEHELRAFPALSADPAVLGDICRVARIPGTFNAKARTYCAALVVRQRRYTEDELADLLGVQLHSRVVHEPPRMAAVCQGDEPARLMAYAAEYGIQQGQRYVYIWTLAQSMLRDHATLTDDERTTLLAQAAALTPPLPEAEVRHAVRAAETAKAKGISPQSQTVADRLGLSPEQRVQYGIGDGHTGKQPTTGPRITVPVDAAVGLLRDALSKPTLPEQYTALETVQPMLTAAMRSEVQAAAPDLYAKLLQRERKQRARPYAELAKLGDTDGLAELREAHKSHYTRDKQRAERKQQRAAAKAQAEATKEAKRAAREAKVQAEVNKAANKAAQKERARQLLAEGLSIRDVAAVTGLSKSTVGRL